MEFAMQAAEKGLAWLRESGPVYGLNVNEVDIKKLDLSSTCRCVLGQLDFSYGTVVCRLVNHGQISVDSVARVQWLQEHGFERTHGTEYHELTEAWRILLERDCAL
jgi:hypothetical protein